MLFSVDVNWKEKCISGWASPSKTEVSEEPVIATLIYSRNPTTSTACTLERPDVQHAGLHPTGLCGFRFYEEDSSLQPGNFYRVEIRHQNKVWLKNILYGSHSSLLDRFNRYELLPRDDYSCLETPTDQVLEDEPDLFSYKRLMIRLRRGKRAHGWRHKFHGKKYSHIETDWQAFREITQYNLDCICHFMNTRYLWSIIDTFADYAELPERSAALAISNYMFQERFAQTLRCAFDFVEKDQPIVDVQIPYGSGLMSNCLSKDDALDVFLTRNLEILENFPILYNFFVEIVMRSIGEPDSILNFNTQYSSYFKDAMEDYKKMVTRNYFSSD